MNPGVHPKHSVSLHTSGLHLPPPPSQGHCHELKDPKIPIPAFYLQCLLQLPQVEQFSTRQTRARYPCIQIPVPDRKCKVLPGLAPTHCSQALVKTSIPSWPLPCFCTWKAPLPRAFSSSQGQSCRSNTLQAAPEHLFLHKVALNITALLQLECPASFPSRQQVGNTSIFL